MSKRRQIGDIVLKKGYAGFSIDPCRVMIPDTPENRKYIDYCFMDCGDNECREWATVWALSDTAGSTIIDQNGKQTFENAFYHVSECQMEDVDA